MKKFSSRLVDVAAAIFAFCVILAFAGVFCRKVLNNSIIWAEEVIRYSFIWLFFLTMPEVTRYGGHLALDLVPMFTKGKARKILFIFIELLNIVFDAVIIYYGIKVSILNMAQFSPSLRIPYGYVYLALPVGAALMLIFSVRRICLLIMDKEEKE